MLIKSHIPSGRVISVLFALLGGCFGSYHTAVAVARLRFASLDLRKASVWMAWLQCGECQLAIRCSQEVRMDMGELAESRKR